MYGVTPVEGFAVYDSGDADYPFTVAGLTGDFKVEGGEPGTDYSYEYKSSTLKILTGKSMTVSMRDGVAQTERDRIVVPVNTNADVALAGVDVRLSGDDDCAFQIELGASAKVTLAADGNSLVSGANRAGLEVSDGASVVIDGKGSLTAKCFSEGFAYGAGIGGGYGGSGGIVKIAGGMVTASCEGVGDYGSSYGAGIGGGSNGSGGSVEITGGEVNASCDGELQANGAGIGAGLIGSNINVKVSGGTVNASCVSLGGPSNGAGIGGGSSGSRDSNVAVSISGGTVTASCENAYGSVYGAGIGGGYYGPNDVLSISGGYIRASGYGSGIGSGERGSVDMSITGGLFADGKVDGGPDGNKVYGVPPAEGFAVYASGDTGYPYAVAGLAGDFQVEGGVRGTDYSYEYKSSTLKILTDVPLSVSMRDGVEQTKRDRIEMFESEVANVTLAGVRIDASGDEYGCAFAMGPRSLANVTLAKGSANSLVSGASRAGLEVGDGASVAIGGEGFLEAKCFSEGDAKGAGIGGCYGATDVSVSISGGTVSASCKGVNGLASGAGIGGGQSGSGGSIEITGGEVTASCESSEYAYGAGIGAGYGGSVVGVDISGGRIKAVSGLVAIDPAAKITGGAFASSDADADVAADEVRAARSPAPTRTPTLPPTRYAACPWGRRTRPAPSSPPDPRPPRPTLWPCARRGCTRRRSRRSARAEARLRVQRRAAGCGRLRAERRDSGAHAGRAGRSGLVREQGGFLSRLRADHARGRRPLRRAGDAGEDRVQGGRRPRLLCRGEGGCDRQGLHRPQADLGLVGLRGLENLRRHDGREGGGSAVRQPGRRGIADDGHGLHRDRRVREQRRRQGQEGSRGGFA